MVEIIENRQFACRGSELFEKIGDIHKLAGIKKDLKKYRVARDEPGLQIIDNVFRIFFIKMPSRLTFSSEDEKSCELKQMKGRLKEYLCLYSIKEGDGFTELSIHLRIKLPYGPIGFIISKIINPAYTARLKKELKLIEKILSREKYNE